MISQVSPHGPALELSPAGRRVLLGPWGMWVLFSGLSLADALSPFL